MSADTLGDLQARVKALEALVKMRDQKGGGDKRVIDVDDPEAQKGGGEDNVVDLEEDMPDAQAPPPAEKATKQEELDSPSADPPTTFKLGGSIWDASLFIGHGYVGAAGSVALSAILLACMVVQGAFCALALDVFTRSKYGDAVTQNMLWWRADAHQLIYELGGLSLVERVCNHDPTLMLGTDIKAKVAMITAYHPHFLDNPLLSGPVMVILVLACWYATLSKELRNILNFYMALVYIPKGRKTMLTRAAGSSTIELSTISRCRCIFGALLKLMRLFVAGTLLYVGTLRTAYTTDWGGILLNAIKLAFIVNVDTLFFTTMAPRNMQALMGSLAPLKVKQVRSWKGVDPWSVATLVWIPALLVIVYVLVIVPELDHQLDAYNALCGGNRAFVHKFHHGQVLWAQGKPYKKRVPGESELYLATQEIAHQSNTDEPMLGFKASSLEHFDTLTRMDTDFLSTFLNTQCLDVLNFDFGELVPPEYFISHADYFHIATGDSSISRCEDVAQYCTVGKVANAIPTHTIHARRFCPLTCGCDIPGRFLLADGCPSMCRGGVPGGQYLTLFAARPCADASAEEVQGDTWRSLAKQQADLLDASMNTPALRAAAGVANLQSFAPPALQEAVQAVQNHSLAEAHEELMLRLGCDYSQIHIQLMWSIGGRILCEYNAIQFFCPHSCFCHMSPCSFAPSQCAGAGR